MRIGIFETDHFEVTYATIRLFDNGQNTITVFTYARSWRQLRLLLGDAVDKYEWIIKEEKESKRHFIYRIYKTTRQQQIDLLLLNTIPDNHLLYAWMIDLLKKVRVVVTLHDINSFFRFQPPFNVRRWIRYIGRRRLISVVKEFNVIALPMVGYLQARLPARKKIHSLPGGIFDRSTIDIPSAPQDLIQIVVPGTLDDRRRNYDQVFELAEACKAANIPVRITLLGGSDALQGKTIIEKCSYYANVRCYHTTIVDQVEFDRVMNEAHCAFTPSVINTIIIDGVTETYGISKSSGNLFDVVRHAKPYIIPAALTMPGNMESSCLRYKSINDILSFLQRMLREPSFYEAITNNALQNSAAYTVPVVRLRNPSLFNLEGLSPLH